MEQEIEKAKKKYKALLKEFKHIDSISNKNYDRTYYKLNGMESILEILGIDITQLQKEVYDNP
jgi:hypothetical protein